jgi:hypothetical protein
MMDDQDDVSIEKLRVDPVKMQRVIPEQQQDKSKREGWQRVFTSVPRKWELRLLQAKRISTYRLAIELLYLHWKGDGKPIIVSSKVAKAVKISARSKWNALAELERLGLIHVDRRRRRSPRVVLLHTQAKQT